MGENTYEIEREIREKRGDLARNLDELGDKARDLANWRVHYRNQPGLFLGAAIAAGMLVGLAAIPSGRRRQPAVSDRDEYDEPEFRLAQRSPGAIKRFAKNTGSRAGQQLGQTWEQMADALLSVGMAKAVQWVSGQVPGFREHYEQRSSTMPVNFDGAPRPPFHH